MKLIKREWITLILSSVSLGVGIHFALAMLFYNGLLDINALHNQSGWIIGEGWLEAGGFILVAMLGFSALGNDITLRLRGQ